MTGTGIGSGDLDACLRLWHAAGVTQADMAALAGVSRPTIARSLKRLGLRDPRRRRMAEIAGDARREPALTYAALARRHGCSVSTVQRALRTSRPHTPERNGTK